MFPRTLKTFIDRNVDINAHLQNLNISVISFPHRDIYHQSYHIEINLYKITYTRFFIQKISPAVIYHVEKSFTPWFITNMIIMIISYHIIIEPHLSFSLFYNKCGTPWSSMSCKETPNGTTGSYLVIALIILHHTNKLNSGDVLGDWGSCLGCFYVGLASSWFVM